MLVGEVRAATRSVGRELHVVGRQRVMFGGGEASSKYRQVSRASARSYARSASASGRRALRDRLAERVGDERRRHPGERERQRHGQRRRLQRGHGRDAAGGHRRTGAHRRGEAPDAASAGAGRAGGRRLPLEQTPPRHHHARQRHRDRMQHRPGRLRDERHVEQRARGIDLQVVHQGRAPTRGRAGPQRVRQRRSARG